MNKSHKRLTSLLAIIVMFAVAVSGCVSGATVSSSTAPANAPASQPAASAGSEAPSGDAASDSGTDPVVTLTLGHVQSAEENVATIFSEAFKEACAKRNIQVDIFPGSQLGNSRDLMEGLRMGTIDLNVTGTADYSKLCSDLGVLDLAYIWKNYDQMFAVLDGEIGQTLAQKLLDESGVRILGYSAFFGSRCVVTVGDKVFTNLDEAKKLNLKVRTIESPVYIGSMQAMGMNPTPMGFSEIYTALQTHVIDGYEHDADTTLANGFDEVAKNFMLTNHMNGPIALYMSEKSFEKLDEKVRQDILEAGREAAAVHRETAPVKEKEKLEELKSTGMNVVEVDTESFAAACNEFNKSYCAENGLTEYYEKIIAQ
ncbi:TRAP transporter substrate-binding protein [Anaerotruncus rubiinfantis]|uniref:TRAP transporter substrate-binding protein n=1 Tax=Anaerotruncus rubiinfantis TaxID=1720200 RepID=UPI00164D8BA6|nr:TRAP transporter substrate-binding protein [Anaerotruncus rubiinfantis]